MTNKTRTYHELKQELDDIVSWFESDAVTIEAAVQKYERAGELVKELEAQLKAAENKISKIKKSFAE